MKLLAFLGSPRSNGNTDTLANKILDGARAAGVDTQSIALRGLEIQPCTGCDRCWKTEKPCIFTDDMTGLYDAIAHSDAFLFATPVYWYGPTTLMKTLIDRLVVFNRPKGRPMVEGKAALVVTAYEEEGPEAVEPLLRMFELGFRYLGLRFIDRLVVDGTGPKGSILSKPEALERAAAIGRSLPAAIAHQNPSPM
jgi:multimeric flavodoxin WrbA